MIIIIIKWTRQELKQMDQRTRNLMTMHDALLPRDDVDRLHESRKEGGISHPSLKSVLTHQSNGLKTTYKTLKEDLLQPPENKY